MNRKKKEFFFCYRLLLHNVFFCQFNLVFKKKKLLSSSSSISFFPSFFRHPNINRFYAFFFLDTCSCLDGKEFVQTKMLFFLVLSVFGERHKLLNSFHTYSAFIHPTLCWFFPINQQQPMEMLY